MSNSTNKVEEYGFQAEMEQLLQLIIHSLYTHKEIFLRELISNASDALHKIRFHGLTEKDYLDEGADLKIDISIDEEGKKIVIKDNGVGMTHDEIIQNIGTIARSGTLQYIEKLKAQQDEKKKGDDIDLIGQFGVGFYSVFMVADEVAVRTRSYKKDEKAFEWKSQGTGKYTIEEIEKTDRGTEIHIFLKKEAEEFASDTMIKNIIQKYSNFVDFPVNVGEEHANKSSAIWRKQASQVNKEEREEFYKFISHDFQEPLGHIHVNAEAPISYSALLFFPQKPLADIFQKPDEFNLHLYVKKVFIQADCKELLPNYLRFMRGVVDSEDLDLNVSREVTQHSPVMAKIKKALVNRVIKQLEKWAEKEPETYMKFYQAFGGIFKEGIESDFEHRERLIELMRYKSTKEPEKYISLAEYKERMKPDQKEIYYLSGQNIDSLLKSPNLEYFAENDIEVLLLDEVVDDYLMPVIAKYKDHEIMNVEKAEVTMETDDKDKVDETIANSFMDRLKKVLEGKVSDVKESHRLKSSPCTLVSSKEAMNSQMEQFMKMMNPDFKETKKILELNLSHPLVKKLVSMFQKNPDAPEFAQAAETLVDASLLREGRLEDPAKLAENILDYLEKGIG